MLGLATSIALLTTISLSAIATNRKVRGGGDYYLICAVWAWNTVRRSA